MANMATNSIKKFFLDQANAIGTLKVMLLTSSHTNNPDTQEFIDDVSANETSGTGYTAGGVALGSVTVTQDDANDRAIIDAADTVINGLTADFQYAAAYFDTGTPATSRILSIHDLGAQSYTGGNLTIQWHANGLAMVV